MLDANQTPCLQELQFDLYDYDPHGMEGQPTTVSPMHSHYLLLILKANSKETQSLDWHAISHVDLMSLFSV